MVAKTILRNRDRLVTRKWLLALWIVIICQFAYFSVQGYWNHHGFLSSINDSGCFDQAIWNCLQSGSFFNTSQFDQPIHWFSLHFQPVLYLFVPLYGITPSVHWLIGAQAIGLTIAAYPIFLATLHITGEARTSFIWSIVYLLNPFILSAAFWDFHPNSMAVPLMAFGVLATLKKRPVMLSITCILLLTIKEHYGLTICGFALLYQLLHKNTKFSLLLGATGLGAFILILGYIMPNLSLTGEQIMLSANQGQLSRYAWLGNNITTLISNILSHPLMVLHTVFIIFDGLIYLITLAGLFFFTPLLAPLLLLPITADILANLLSANMMPRLPISYHSAPLIPLFLIAAAQGTQKIQHRFKRYSMTDLALFCTIIPLVSSLMHPSWFPSSFQLRMWNPVQRINSKDHRIQEINNIIKDGTVTVQANVGPHFSQRKEIYRFPEKIGSSQFIVLHLQSPTKNIKLNDLNAPRRNILASLSHHLQMNPRMFVHTTKNIITDSNYGIRYYNEPWLVLQHQFPVSGQQKLVSRLNELENTWETQQSFTIQ